MKYNPEIHHRRSNRLQTYDYSNHGAYFVTICTWNRESILGNVINTLMRLTRAGETVMTCWQDLPNHYGNIELDEFVIMPNHLHGIIWMNVDMERAGLKPSPAFRQPHEINLVTRKLQFSNLHRILTCR